MIFGGIKLMEKIYFIGINGIGMSGFVKIMKCKGYDVKGVDICINYVIEEFLLMGIVVYNEYDEENVKGVDYVIVLIVIKESNFEFFYVKNNGIEILKRGELLVKFLNREIGIVVVGIYGKIIIFFMFLVVMLLKDLIIVVGGILLEIKFNVKFGKSEYFIVEVDESDNLFLFMNFKYVVIINIDVDYLDVYGNFDNIKKFFIKFICYI